MIACAAKALATDHPAHQHGLCGVGSDAVPAFTAFRKTTTPAERLILGRRIDGQKIPSCPTMILIFESRIRRLRPTRQSPTVASCSRNGIISMADLPFILTVSIGKIEVSHCTTCDPHRHIELRSSPSRRTTGYRSIFVPSTLVDQTYYRRVFVLAAWMTVSPTRPRIHLKPVAKRLKFE
jgi:hypothetical protein